MNLPPLLKQFFVASAPQLAALSAGGFTTFPGVLLPQLNANDSTIQLDVHLSSWIGSTHGLSGVVACLMPVFMQYKGRKLSFILSCILGLIGWMTIYFAQSAAILIVAEAIHGLSGGCILTCSLLTISEMVHPKFRILSMNFYLLVQAFGLNLMFIIGRYFSWRTIGLIECVPLILALLISFTWPESPSWLAYKGEFEKCEVAFKWLRGSDTESDRELKELIRARKETLAIQKLSTTKLKNTQYDTVLNKIMQRDFYLPCLHMFVLICALSWSGMSVILVYATTMMQHVTRNESAASVGMTVIYSIVFFGNALGLILVNFLKTKTIIIAGGVGVIFFMLSACIVSYLQEINMLSSDSLLCLYFLICYAVSYNIGADICIMSVAAELMPIKHRGIGGALYIIIGGLLDFSTLKLSPYLFLYIKPWGTFMVFSLNVIICMFFIWRYVPETKYRTLQEIEDYYNLGHFVRRGSDDNVYNSIVLDLKNFN